MKSLPMYYDTDYDNMEPDMERINEAKQFIRETLTKRLPLFREFQVGFSGGKDSCVLLQLIIEVCRDLDNEFPEGNYLKRLVVGVVRTRYEVNYQWEFLQKQIEGLRNIGVRVEVGQTILEESFGVVTLGCGVISQFRKFRLCNKMKETIWTRFGKRFPFSFSGVRSEESAKRAEEPRIKMYCGTLETHAAIKYLLKEDVWGYIRKMGTLAWGTKYEDLKFHYSQNPSGREGCWVCCFHKGTYGYTPAQKVVIEKLDAIRNTYTNNRHKYLPGEVLNGLDYPGRTVDFPTAVSIPLTENFWHFTGQNGIIRPWNVCRQAYKIVCDIEKEYGEEDKIIFEDEKHIIPDLQMMRERYGIRALRRWMLNPDTWCGRKLIDLDPLTLETYKKYYPPARVIKRCPGGDWFGRYAREVERLPLYQRWACTRGVPDLESSMPYYVIKKDLKQEMLNSDYMIDESKHPWEHFFDEGDPCNVGQENLKLEQLAANWYKN